MAGWLRAVCRPFHYHLCLSIFHLFQNILSLVLPVSSLIKSWCLWALQCKCSTIICQDMEHECNTLYICLFTSLPNMYWVLMFFCLWFIGHTRQCLGLNQALCSGITLVRCRGHLRLQGLNRTAMCKISTLLAIRALPPECLLLSILQANSFNPHKRIEFCF